MISLVPTQLRRLLAYPDGPAWLRTFDCVLMGGAAIPGELLTLARRERLPLALGYGMTETAAFVALLTPSDFLSPDFDPTVPPQGRVLPHVRIRILSPANEHVPEGTPGRVCINHHRTQDEGILQNNRLSILGRLDQFIVTGGEKVEPRLVENILRQTPTVRAALVVGEPDPEWGQRLVALIELVNPNANPTTDLPATLSSLIRAKLAPHCVPKRWHIVPRLPFDEKGKLDHSVLAQILTSTATLVKSCN